MEIIYTDHFLEQYGARLSKIESSVQKGRLDREIKTRGVFYLNPDGGLLCVVGNLKVYCAAVAPQENKLIFTTTYAYTQDLKGWLIKMLRVRIPGVGKTCENSVSLEQLIAEGAKLAQAK